MIHLEDLMRTTVFTVSWTVVILRTPAAIRSAHQRWIWLTVTSQSVVTLIDLRPVTRFIDAATGIPHAADLSKHLAALVFVAALLAFILHVRASGASIPAWKRWIPFCLAGTTALIMVTTFPFAHPTRDRFLPPPATWDVLDIYWAPFLIYYAVVTALAARLFWGYLKQVRGGLLHTGMTIMAIATGVGLTYVASRALMLLTASRTVVGVMSVTSSSFFLLIAVGGSLVALEPLIRQVSDWRNRRRLHPLWRALVHTAPHVILEPSAPPWGEFLAFKNAHFYLYRRVIEIRDAILILRDYVTPDTVQDIDQFLEEQRASCADTEPLVTACWLQIARQHMIHGTPPQPHALNTTELGGDNLDSEVRFLLKISNAWHTPLVRQTTHRFAPVETT
ncbi:MAG: MAB_1171c family putative transporter [Pseudonocardiaceae bacterium]